MHKNIATSLRLRRATDEPVRQSKCFHRRPPSSSWTQTAFAIVSRPPSSVTRCASRNFNAAPGAQSQRFGLRECAFRPSPSSPASKAALRWFGGYGSAYGTHISENERRHATGRPWKRSALRIRPSREEKERTPDQCCQRKEPSACSSKPAPSGWLVDSGFSGGRVASPSVSGKRIARDGGGGGGAFASTSNEMMDGPRAAHRSIRMVKPSRGWQ